MTVLIKGSRINRLERVVQALTGGVRRRLPHDASKLIHAAISHRISGQVLHGFHVFQYLTLRGILAAVTTLLMALIIGPRMIEMLGSYQIGQRVRTDGPQTHLTKTGTPTMGGGLILVAMAFGTLLWADLSSRFVWILLATTLAFGLIGFYDDYLKLVVGNSKGLAARYKYLAQSVVGSGGRAGAAWPASDRRGDLAVRAVLQDGGRAHVDARLSSCSPTS